MEFSVESMCRVLEVGKSGFYAALKRPASAREVRRKELLLKIKNVHEENRCIYGSPRVFAELRAQGVSVCENTIAKLMGEAELRSKIVKRFVPNTTDSTHAFPVAENVLDRQFEASAPNRKWVADITYIATDEGWLFLAGVLDLHSRKVVGWSMAEHMKTELVEDALKMALARRN